MAENNMTDKQITALGKFLIETQHFENRYKRGGAQKLQKIIGNDIFYQKNKKWFFNLEILKNMSLQELENLTQRVMK